MQKMECVFFVGFIIFCFLFFISFLCILDGGLQKHQVIVTSLGCCCRHSGGLSIVQLLEFLQHVEKDGGG